MGGGFYSPETPAGCERELLEVLLPKVLGREFSSLLDLNEELLRLPNNSFARAAVETAAWEVAAKQRNQSLRSLLQIPDRPIPSGLALGLYPTAAELQAAIQRFKPAQYARLKLKIQPGQDIEVVRTARSLLGDFPISVDANAAYDLSQSDIFRTLDCETLIMYEQPFAKGDLDGLAALKQQTITPLCLDESIDAAEDVDRFVLANACDIVNIKLQRVGGYLPALRILDACERHGLPVWMGTMPELGIGSAQALVLAAHPQFVMPTDVEPSERWFLDDLLEPEILLANRAIDIPAGPGIGFRVAESKLDRYTTACHTMVS